MNNKIYFLSLLLLIFVFTSCEEKTEAGKFDNWRARNEAFMDSLQTVYDTKPNHGGLLYINALTDPATKIFYKDITPSTNVVVDQKPLYTESVKTYYRGTYIFGEKFDENFSGANPDPEFDSPATFPVRDGLRTSVIIGWTEILQNMKKGQRWMVYIPWVMGYGSTDQTDRVTGVVTIPAYSTLIFDMQLQDIIK